MRESFYANLPNKREFAAETGIHLTAKSARNAKRFSRCGVVGLGELALVAAPENESAICKYQEL